MLLGGRAPWGHDLALTSPVSYAVITARMRSRAPSLAGTRPACSLTVVPEQTPGRWCHNSLVGVEAGQGACLQSETMFLTIVDFDACPCAVKTACDWRLGGRRRPRGSQRCGAGSLTQASGAASSSPRPGRPVRVDRDVGLRRGRTGRDSSPCSTLPRSHVRTSLPHPGTRRPPRRLGAGSAHRGAGRRRWRST